MSIDDKVAAAWKIAFEYFLKQELDRQRQTGDHDRPEAGDTAAGAADAVVEGVLNNEIEQLPQTTEWYLDHYNTHREAYGRIPSAT
jgi:hypothetical protein